jgi:hypothetical protein
MDFHEKFESMKGKAGEFAENAKDVAGDFAETAVAKSKQMLEITRLNFNSAGEESIIKKNYTAIGKLYYELNGENPEAPYAEYCEKIKASKAAIAANKAKIAAMKQKADSEEIADGE